MAHLLAQANASSFLHVAGRALLVVTVAIVLLVIGLWLKRRILGGPEPDLSLRSAGFGVGDLRRMRDAGELSEGEFERARAKLVAGARRMANEEAGDPPAERDKVRGKDLDLIHDVER